MSSPIKEENCDPELLTDRICCDLELLDCKLILPHSKGAVRAPERRQLASVPPKKRVGGFCDVYDTARYTQYHGENSDRHITGQHTGDVAFQKNCYYEDLWYGHGCGVTCSVVVISPEGHDEGLVSDPFPTWHKRYVKKQDGDNYGEYPPSVGCEGIGVVAWENCLMGICNGITITIGAGLSVTFSPAQPLWSFQPKSSMTCAPRCL